MDAMPIRFDQELSGWASQIRHGIERLDATQPRLLQLALGGTAVGTGINADPRFGKRFARALATRTGLKFVTANNYFEALSEQDTAVELTGKRKDRKSVGYGKIVSVR